MTRIQLDFRAKSKNLQETNYKTLPLKKILIYQVFKFSTINRKKYQNNQVFKFKPIFRKSFAH